MSKPPINLVSPPRLARWRRFKDLFAKHGIALGGLSVIGAVLLIFFYLAWEVIPLFLPADSEPMTGQVPVAEYPIVYVELDEQEEVALTVSADGRAGFHRLADGDLVKMVELPLGGAQVTAAARSTAAQGWVALGLSDGRVLVTRVRYESIYPDGERVIVPHLEMPYGEAPLDLGGSESPIVSLVYADDEARLTLVSLDQAGRIRVARFDKDVNFLTEEVELSMSAGVLAIPGSPPIDLALSANQRWIYVAMDGGTLAFVDISRVGAPEVISQEPIVSGSIRTLTMLLGGISLLVGDDQGIVTQLFPVRDAAGRFRLNLIRTFDALDAPLSAIIPEQRRKGFVAIDESGELGVFHSTAGRTVLTTRPSSGAPMAIALSPRSTALMLVDDQGAVSLARLHNEHPEVSWTALWGEVWYENYTEPAFTWQSSAANNDFEPKFSLMPLAFGTLKAAIYAMLFAVPLAIAAAIYTAYFMSPGMRRAVKPTIEIMAALPTVILGFLAGLWFAPYLEENLTGVLLSILILPPGVLLSAWIWRSMPGPIQHAVPEGWQAALLVPAVIALVWGSLALGEPLEMLILGQELRTWMNHELGITYDQRNALVVGAAMGFAVIPTIFSIAEDAVFSVPKSLTQGSLALGATLWQTMVRVVLPTASPGIFSALMIGFGRAVGETMIVLMATGNTPLMDMNIFEGMRTLAANIAVEMPESEVGSTHYRVLFLAAFVLFLFTFVVNTGAEIIRQRLRDKYSNL